MFFFLTFIIFDLSLELWVHMFFKLCSISYFIFAVLSVLYIYVNSYSIFCLERRKPFVIFSYEVDIVYKITKHSLEYYQEIVLFGHILPNLIKLLMNNENLTNPIYDVFLNCFVPLLIQINIASGKQFIVEDKDLKKETTNLLPFTEIISKS